MLSKRTLGMSVGGFWTFWENGQKTFSNCYRYDWSYNFAMLWNVYLKFSFATYSNLKHLRTARASISEICFGIRIASKKLYFIAFFFMLILKVCVSEMRIRTHLYLVVYSSMYKNIIKKVSWFLSRTYRKLWNQTWISRVHRPFLPRQLYIYICNVDCPEILPTRTTPEK